LEDVEAEAEIALEDEPGRAGPVKDDSGPLDANGSGSYLHRAVSLLSLEVFPPTDIALDRPNQSLSPGNDAVAKKARLVGEGEDWRSDVEGGDVTTRDETELRVDDGWDPWAKCGICKEGASEAVSTLAIAMAPVV
jgi:hypothetical protein